MSTTTDRKTINSLCLLDTPKIHEFYLESLDEKHLTAYAIAKKHLGTSFDLEKSIGFQKWKKATYMTTATSSS